MEDEEAFSPAAIPRILRTGPKGSPLHPRITMNLAMILQCRKLILLIQGTEKAAVLAASKTDTDLPVHRLISQTVTPVNIIRDGDIAT